jgi:glycosyltransferase involved in cell wall biosynthesis
MSDVFEEEEGRMRKYSIIVVTRNNASGLSSTLRSIRQLDHEQKETIVIDGASDDNTMGILAENEDIVTHFVSEKDTGIYNAMNKGIGYVTGDYVVFMNAGDCFADSNVLLMVNGSDGDIILGGESYGGKVRMVKPQMSLYDILSMGINHQAVYYRREVLQRYGFDESYRLIADLKSVVEPLVKEKITVTCVPEILAVCEGGGLSQQRWKDIRKENRRIIEEVVEPYYKTDYLRFSRINPEMLDDFAVLSAFRSVYPLIRMISKVLRFLNKKFKHIPLD